MSDYTTTPWDMGVEDKLIPKGEHTLRIADAEDKQTKGNPEKGTPQRRMITVMLEADGLGDDYAPIFHQVVLPNADEYSEFATDEQKRAAKFMILNARRFFQIFGIKESTFDTDGAACLPGATGRCTVTHEMYEGNLQTRIQLPRLK